MAQALSRTTTPQHASPSEEPLNDWKPGTELDPELEREERGLTCRHIAANPVLVERQDWGVGRRARVSQECEGEEGTSEGGFEGQTRFFQRENVGLEICGQNLCSQQGMQRKTCLKAGTA